MTDLYVTVETEQSAFVTVDAQKVAEVAAVGIQGMPGVAGTLGAIPDVEIPEDAADGSILVLNASEQKWIATRILEKQDITGGHY